MAEDNKFINDDSSPADQNDGAPKDNFISIPGSASAAPNEVGFTIRPRPLGSLPAGPSGSTTAPTPSQAAGPRAGTPATASTPGELLSDGRRPPSSDNRPMIDASASGQTNPTGFVLRPNNLSGGLPGNNVLNNYINVAYHIKLSMVKQSDVEGIQTGKPAQSRIDDTKFTFASSGGVGVNTSVAVDSGDDGQSSSKLNVSFYGIRKLNFTNFLSQTPQNPMFSQMIEAKLTVMQPWGFSLHKELLDIAHAQGYKDVNPGRLIYELTVHWSGFDQDSGQWTPKIPLFEGSNVNLIRYYVIITAIEAKPAASGTEYQLSLLPYAAFAIKSESFVVDGGSVPSGGSSTFKPWLDALGAKLSAARSDRTSTQVRATYKFECPKILANATFTAPDNRRGDITRTNTNGQNVAMPKNIDIASLLRQVMADISTRQTQFLQRDGNDGFLYPRVDYTLRINTKYGPFDPTLNDFNDNTYTFFIEPHLTYRTGNVDAKNMQAYIDRNNQIKRINAIYNLNMVLREYEYFFTGKNTEIISFDFKYNNFYYAPVGVVPNTPGTTSQGTVATPSDTQQVATEEASGLAGGATRVSIPGIDLFGTPAGRAPALGAAGGVDPKSSIARTFQGRDDKPLTSGSLSNTNNTSAKATFLQDYESYLRYDMMVIDNLVVRGDPVWLMNVYSDSDKTKLTFFLTEGDSEDIKPRTQKIILIHAFMPSQANYLTAPQVPDSRSTTLAGFYEINKVQTDLSEGKFTQTLTGLKLTHIDYIDAKVLQRNAARQTTTR